MPLRAHESRPDLIQAEVHTAAYNEVFDHGQLRSHYRTAWNAYQRKNTVQIASMARTARIAFHGDAPVMTFPRILTSAEQRLLRSAVAQRGRAIHAFLVDHYLGAKTYRKARIIAPATLKRILARHPPGNPPRDLKPEEIQFWYAPDLIRGPDGQFRVLEDNLTFAGGLGDLGALPAAARAIRPPRSLLVAQPDPSRFYRQLAAQFRQTARQFGAGAAVMLSYHRDLCDTNEDLRFEQALAPLGVISVRTPGARQVGSGLRFSDGNLVHGSSANPVSYVAINVEPEDIEAAGLPGFWSAVAQRRFGVSTWPGLEFTNDKEFYLYVDAWIRFYLRQSPKVRSLATYAFSGSAKLASPVSAVFAQLDHWVIKGVRGRCGEKVWIGNRLATAEARRLHRRVRAHPENFIFQRFTPLSTVLDHHVDLRYHAVIGPRRPIVSTWAWGRAIPVGGNGKVNISNQGALSIVLTSPD